MMGLAVGIDYSLFIVSRYREERQRGLDTLDAIGRSGATANRAVFFSGLTVVLALAGMLLVPTTIFRALAGGAILVVLVSIALSMTLLPALLAFFGKPAPPMFDWIDWPWKSLVGNVFVLVLILVVGGVGVAIASAAGIPAAGTLIALALVGGFLVLLTKGIRRRAGWARWLTKAEAHEHGKPGGFWDKATRTVMARPWTWLLLTSGFLIVLSLPYWLQGHPEDDGRGIKTGFSGIADVPDGIQTKDAYEILIAKFPQAPQQSTADVVISGPATDPAVAQGIDTLQTALAGDSAFGDAQPPVTSPDGEVTLLRVPYAGAAGAEASSEAAVAAVTRLRDDYIPAAFGEDAGVLVGGDTAFVKDFFDISDFYTPVIIALVLLLSFMLLTIVFRSIVVPAKAIVMNLLSVGAAYGLIVLMFQDGGPAWAASIADTLGFIRVQAIESWLPLFLFSILFGLSMDYQVFLLTRIREEYDKTGDNSEAVAFGLRTTGGIITGAAAIMVAVFGAFATGRIAGLQQMGFGLAVAVLLDATIVRSILVPSAMKLLGDRNWYLPRFLQWLPAIDVEGHRDAIVVPASDEIVPIVEPVVEASD
jgi:RND superfamily putative drug exporter